MMLHLDAAPASRQSRQTAIAALRAIVQEQTGQYQYLLTGDVSMEITWHFHERDRYESDASADIDNLLKPMLEAFCGPNGLLVDDCRDSALLEGALVIEANCKVPRSERSWPALDRAGMLRQPAGVTFGEVTMAWHVQQNDRPLVSSRGHLSDHFALSVTNLNAWIAKLRGEGVIFLTKPTISVLKGR